MPTTRAPDSTSSAAAVALSTPPESATTIGGLLVISKRTPKRARSMRYIAGVIKGVHRLRLDALDDEGAGEGTPGDVDPPVRLRVPFALPGEEVVAAVEHASPHRPVAWGRLVELLAPSPSRVAPACAAWGRCGGCVVQHLAYDEQLAWKRSLVEAALRHAGLDGAVEPCVPSPSVLGYRDNAKLVFARDGERVILGAYAPRSHDVVDLAGCAVVAEPLDAVARAIARLATELGVRPYDERTGEGDARYALLRATRDRSTQVTLVVARRGVAAIAELARALRRERPEVRGVVENLQPARTNALVGRTEPDRLLDGDPVLEERLG